jgi:hypothetical protein
MNRRLGSDRIHEMALSRPLFNIHTATNAADCVVTTGRIRVF